MHISGQTFAHGDALSGEEIAGFGNQFGIVFARNFVGAGAGAPFDLIEQTGAAAVFEIAVGAGAQQEGALQRIERA